MIRAFRKHYRRITAFILTLVLTCMNIGTNLHVAFAVGEEEEALFLVDGAELKEAIREACDSGEVFDFADLNLKAKTKTLKNAYEKLLGKKEGAVYELDVPVNDDYAPDGTSVKVFYNAATEDVAFLFINESDMVVTFRANVDGYETNRVTVNPNPANVEDGETAVYVEDYSNTIMIDDMPQTLGAELIGTEGNAEAREGEPEQETEAEAPDGSESLEASTAAEEMVEMTEEAEAEDTAAETLPEEAETKETEAVVEEQPEEETEAVVIEIESVEETEEEAATESEVVIEPETETGELVGMSHHLVDRVGTPEETRVIILDETEETTEAPEEEAEQEAEETTEAPEEETEQETEETTEAPEETAAESIEETEEKEPEGNESSVEETTATAAADTEEESEEAVMEESSSAAVSEETEEQESSTEEITEAAVEETTEGSVTEETEAPEDGQLLIDDVNADGETAVVVLGDLEGKPYNTVTIWDSANARAFKVSVEDLKGIEAFGSYAVDYSVDPLGTAEVEGPSYIAEGEDLYFSVTPQVGYVIEQVLANGEEVEPADEVDLASLSDATKSNADPEDAEEGTALYVIPNVQEDQEIEVILAEEVLGSHPEFHEEKTVNGVTITVSAEEGILPAGTTLSVEEVTEQVADAVKENVEAEGKTTVTDVLAYDINLMLDGKKLSNSYWEGNYVNVKFEGSKIEEISKNADSLQIVSLETPTETVEAALGTTEEIPVLDNLIANDIEVKKEGREEIDVEGDASVEAVQIEAAHFTIYAVVGGVQQTGTSYTINIGDRLELESNLESHNYVSVSHSWKSDNSAVASVEDQNDTTTTVTGVSAGEVTITHTLKYKYVSWGKTYTEDDTFTIIVVEAGDPTITFNANGGSGETLPEPITSTVGETITMPSYGGTITGKTFVGWSPDPNATSSGSNHYTQPVYLAGSEYLVEESTTLYAVWASSDLNANFYIRKDGTIPDEPSSYLASLYTSGIYIEGVIKKGYFVSDPTGVKVSNNLNRVPTTEEIQKVLSTYNPDTQYIIWYVIKYEGGHANDAWNIDGVVLEKSKINLYYRQNTPNQKAVEGTFPLGSQYHKNDEVTVDAGVSFSLPGYVFVGWNTEADGSGTNYAGSSKFNITEDTILYAQWRNANAGLELRKALVDAGSGDDVSNVTFALYKANDKWEKVSDTPLISSIQTKSNGTVAIQLEYDENNDRYLLYEITTAPGYMLLSEPIKLEVTFDSSNKITYKVNGSETEYSLANPYTINNYKGVEFPITGGPGLGFIKEFGWMLLLLAAAMAGIEVGFYGRRRKKA